MRAGGGNGLRVAGAQVTLVQACDLVEDPLLLPLFIHCDDAGLPLWVGVWDIEAGVGNEGGVAGEDPQLYCLHQGLSLAFVASESRKLGFFLQFLKVGGGGIIPYLKVKHPLFVDFFNCRILELGVDHFQEVILFWVLESGRGGIPA